MLDEVKPKSKCVSFIPWKINFCDAPNDMVAHSLCSFDLRHVPIVYVNLEPTFKTKLTVISNDLMYQSYLATELCLVMMPTQFLGFVNGIKTTNGIYNDNRFVVRHPCDSGRAMTVCEKVKFKN